MFTHSVYNTQLHSTEMKESDIDITCLDLLNTFIKYYKNIYYILDAQNTLVHYANTVTETMNFSNAVALYSSLLSACFASYFVKCIFLFSIYF